MDFRELGSSVSSVCDGNSGTRKQAAPAIIKTTPIVKHVMHAAFFLRAAMELKEKTNPTENKTLPAIRKLALVDPMTPAAVITMHRISSK